MAAVRPRSTQHLPAPLPSDDQLALRSRLPDFSRRRSAGAGARPDVAAERTAGMHHEPIHRLRHTADPKVPRLQAQEATAGDRPACGGEPEPSGPASAVRSRPDAWNT